MAEEEGLVEEMLDGDHELLVLPTEGGIYQPTEEFEDGSN